MNTQRKKKKKVTSNQLKLFHTLLAYLVHFNISAVAYKNKTHQAGERCNSSPGYILLLPNFSQCTSKLGFCKHILDLLASFVLTWVGRFQCFLKMKTPTKTPVSSANPPSIHRLSAWRALLPSAAASSPKILAKQSCKDSAKEGQSLTGSHFKHSYTINEHVVHLVIYQTIRKQRWQESGSANWRDHILIWTADRSSGADIDLSYLIAFRQMENIWGHRTENRARSSFFFSCYSGGKNKNKKTTASF